MRVVHLFLCELDVAFVVEKGAEWTDRAGAFLATQFLFSFFFCRVTQPLWNVMSISHRHWPPLLPGGRGSVIAGWWFLLFFVIGNKAVQRMNPVLRFVLFLCPRPP